MMAVGLELMAHSQSPGRHNLASARAALDCEATWHSNDSIWQPVAGESIPAAKAVEDRGIPNTNRDEIPSDSDESTS